MPQSEIIGEYDTATGHFAVLADAPELGIAKSLASHFTLPSDGLLCRWVKFHQNPSQPLT